MGDKILVTGVGGPAGRSIATYLQKKGFNITGTDITSAEAPMDAFYVVPQAKDNSFRSAILDIIRKEKISLFVPTVTEELPVVSRLKEVVNGLGCAVYISPVNAVDIANDKLQTALFMAEHDIPVPVTFNGKTDRRAVIEKLGLPLLSKPCFGRGGRGVKLYRSPAELYNEIQEDIVYQEFISGEEFDLNLFMEKGDLLAGVVLKKTILKQGIVGNALAVERTERKDIIHLGIKAANLLAMEGPLDMDIRLRANGEPVLLEINARAGGNILFAPEILDSLISAWRCGICV